MSDATQHDDGAASYDDELVEEWQQLQESGTTNGPLRPTSGSPIPNNAGFMLT